MSKYSGVYNEAIRSARAMSIPEIREELGSLLHSDSSIFCVERDVRIDAIQEVLERKLKSRKSKVRGKKAKR